MSKNWTEWLLLKNNTVIHDLNLAKLLEEEDSDSNESKEDDFDSKFEEYHEKDRKSAVSRPSENANDFTEPMNHEEANEEIEEASSSSDDDFLCDIIQEKYQSSALQKKQT